MTRQRAQAGELGGTGAANLESLQRAQPGFVLPQPLEPLRAVTGAWRMVDGGRTVALHGRDPEREADCAAAELLAGGNPPLVVAVGLGLGFLLDALERRGWEGKVLALEPEPATVAPMLARRDWRAWIASDRLRLLLAPDYAGAGDCGGWFGDGAEEPRLFVHPVLGRVRAAEVARARAVIDRIRFGAQANAQARRRFGKRYLLNTLANIPALAREGDVSSLAGRGRGIAAVVIAAGPSLDGSIDALRDLRDRALIIAVDTALRPLLAAGIAPHLVVAVDPGEANARHLWDLPPSPATHLVAEASLDPSALAGFRGRTFLFSVSDHEPWPWLRAHGAGRGRLRAWGSVLTSAFDLALQMDCNPIAFAGADLAFTGLRPYARGVVYEEDWRRLADWGMAMEEQWREQVESWPRTEERDLAGAPARTAPQLVAFRNWLVERIGREPSRRIVNATGAGILCGPHIEQLPLDRLAAELPPLEARPEDLVRSRYAPARPGTLMEAAARLAEEEDATLAAWEGFADGVSRPLILSTVDEALRGRAPSPVAAPGPSAHAEMCVDAFWLEPLARHLPLTAMSIPAERLEPYADGVRRFRFRTTTARLMTCVLRLPDDAVIADGRPLPRAESLEALRPGECYVWRDEIYIAGAGGADPRTDGRAYSLLVPDAVAYAERLPLHEILAHNI